MDASKLVDDALAKVSDLGTVGAMKWLAAAIAPPVAAGSVHDVCRDSERFYRQNCLAAIERAEKAEAELEDWIHTNRIDELQRSLVAAEARVKELEAAYQEVLRRCL